MGITIFIIFILIAFFIGKSIRGSENKINISKYKKKRINAESISPDAHWLKTKDNK